MNRIKQRTSKVTSISHSTVPRDITPDGVRIFHKKEGELLPEGIMYDQSVHTIVIFHTDTNSIHIVKRRIEEPVIRDYVDPVRFENHKVETINWDHTFTYKGETSTHTYDHPIAPITFCKTVEQKMDEANLLYHRQTVEYNKELYERMQTKDLT